MPKQDRLDVDFNWPPPGRGGVHARDILNKNENNLHNLGNFRCNYENYDPGPARTKPLDPSLFGAEDFLRRAVGGNASLLGWSHPKTIKALTDLARAQYDQGRSLEAESLLRKSHFEMVNTFGPYHLNTVEVAILLAQVLEHQIPEVEEIKMKRQSIVELQQLEIEYEIKSRELRDQQTLGDAATVDIKRTTHELSIVVKDIVDLRKVVALAYEEQYGPNHRNTAEAVLNLGNAMIRWAIFFGKDGSDKHRVLWQVKELQKSAREIIERYVETQPPSHELYVPSYGTGHPTNKGRPPVPTFSTIPSDFNAGHAGILM